MSNVSKTAKRAELRTQIAKLLAKLAELTTEPDAEINFFDIEARRRSRVRSYEERRQAVNIKKKIDFLRRKLDKLEGASQL